MALRDYVVQNLRALLGVDRDERAKAESPSAEAARRFPTVFSMAGREDLHGALTVTNSLQEIYADYEAMYDYPDIRTAFWYFASDATQPNIDNGRVLWVTSRDAAIAGSANNLIQHRLRLEEEMFPYAFELCWMGNSYLEPLLTENGVVGLNSLPPVTMRRIEMPNGGLVGYVQDITCRFTANQAFLRQAVAGSQELPENVVTFEDWQIVHFRLRSHSPRATYGKSVADAARWLWRRIVMLDDMIMMNRLTRIPRYAYYVDVTDVPPAKRDAALRQAKQDLRKKQGIDPRTGRMDSRYNVAALDEDLFFAVTNERPLSRVEVVAAPDVITTTDAEFFKRMLHSSLMVPRAYMGQDAPIAGRAVLCLTGDTKIPLLDGRTRTMVELAAEYGDGTPFHVYTVGHDGRITTGVAHHPQMTRPDAEVWAVTLDNGEVIKGTPDHPFMRRDGTYCRLDELQAGDPLMPLYRRSSEAGRDGMDGYEMVQDPTDETWCFTHRLVAAGKWPERDLRSEHAVVHHADFNKLNNDPSNLEAMHAAAHLDLHRRHAERTIGRPDVRARAIEASAWWRNSDANKALCRLNLKKARAVGGGQRAWCTSPAHRALKAVQMRAQWAEPDSALWARTQTAAFRQWSSERMAQSIREGKLKVRGADNAKWRTDASYARLLDVAVSYRCQGMRDLVKWTGYSSCLIYRLLRDEGLTYAQFAEQHMAGYRPLPCMAARQPRNHKVVSVVRLQTREDCYDFVVDGTHNYAVAAGVFVHNSNEDVRAARVTLTVQKELRQGIERLIRIDQAARGYPNPQSTKFEVNMTVPSGIYELAALEVRSARADFAARIEPYMSMRWIREHVFKLNDEEIAAIEAQRKQEALAMLPPDMQGQEGPPQPEFVTPETLPQSTDARLDTLLGRKPTAAESKGWDRARRLEEERDRRSRQNHQMLIDKLNMSLQRDEHLAKRVDQVSGLITDLREAALRTDRNGRVQALPAGRGRRPMAPL